VSVVSEAHDHGPQPVPRYLDRLNGRDKQADEPTPARMASFAVEDHWPRRDGHSPHRSSEHLEGRQLAKCWRFLPLRPSVSETSCRRRHGTPRARPPQPCAAPAQAVRDRRAKGPGSPSAPGRPPPAPSLATEVVTVASSFAPRAPNRLTPSWH
jgi:hypothetical protein